MDISNTIAIVRDEGLSPAQSPNTRLVASARACGFDWGQKNPFMDSIEELKDGGIKRTVTFVMDGAQVVPFMWATREDGRLVAKEEEITLYQHGMGRGEPRSPDQLSPRGSSRSRTDAEEN